ncbi:MAG: hypothetical protein WC426_12840 [Sulfuriferula sp.]
MQTSELLRHQKINSLTAQDTEKIVDAAIDLWDRMATQIISIVGEAGFNSLYTRSVFLTQSTFPWFTADTLSAQADQRFETLKTSLQKQTPIQACEANTLLLITFTDILATLIGEELTTSILRTAWVNDVTDKTDKEFKNE